VSEPSFKAYAERSASTHYVELPMFQMMHIGHAVNQSDAHAADSLILFHFAHSMWRFRA
jgi:hypothetical protein